MTAWVWPAIVTVSKMKMAGKPPWVGPLFFSSIQTVAWSFGSRNAVDIPGTLKDVSRLFWTFIAALLFHPKTLTA